MAAGHGWLLTPRVDDVTSLLDAIEEHSASEQWAFDRSRASVALHHMHSAVAAVEAVTNATLEPVPAPTDPFTAMCAHVQRCCVDGVHEVAKVVSVDHLAEELQYVRDGQVQALIGQDCYGWGYETVMMLFNKVHNGESPEQVINTFDLQIVNQENVEDYADIWKKWVPNG